VPDRDQKLYAVLIDGDNIPAKFAGAILKEVTSLGEPALRKVYGDWTSPGLKKWKGAGLSHGLVLHQETANTSRKNASDIGMVIDAMDILHSGRLDGFVIVSSDSDFTRLASRIREHGLDVIGMGMDTGETKSPKSFVNACQRFIYLENLEGDEPSADDASADTASVQVGEDNNRTGSPAPANAKKAPPKLNPTKAILLIRRAMEKMDPDNEWYALSPLGHFIQADSPDFDTRSYGKAKLSDLLSGLKEFELKKFEGHLRVRRLD